MRATWYRVRGELRSRWRALLPLVAIVGVAGAVVLTSAAGARRSSDAYDRFRVETLASDLDVAFDSPPGGSLEATAERVRALPQVEALTHAVFPFVVPAGSGAYPYLDFLAIAGADDAFGRDVDRPRIIAGRAPHVDRPAEIAIAKIYADETDLQVGERVEFESFAPEQVESLFGSGDAGQPAGPRFTFRVTGVLDAPTFLSESTGSFQPRVLLSPAFVEQHQQDVGIYPGGFTVRLRNGRADVPEVSAALRAMFPDSTLELTPTSEVDVKVESSIDVIVTALVLTAAAAALAGGVAVAQAISRHLSSRASDGLPLAALGMTRRDRVAARVVALVPVALGGAALAVGVAILASPLMPLGVARRAEPDPGMSLDRAVLSVGAGSIVVGTILLATWIALRHDRRSVAPPGADGGGRASRTTVAISRTGGSPSATIGIGLALDRRAGSGWAVPSALGGVAFGVAGVVAVLVFVTSLDTLVESSDRYGAPFDAAVAGFGGDDAQDDRILADDPDVAQLGVLSTGIVRIDGTEVNSHAFSSLEGDMALTITDGRLPRAAGEVVFGSSTLEDAGLAVGDEVDVDGAEGTVAADIVGVGVFPVIDERSSAGRGVLLGIEDLARISSPGELNRDVMIRWADGVDAAAATAALAEQSGAEVYTPRLPSDVNNLSDVASLPRLIALFLALLGALAATHGLVSTGRSRRVDLALLRSLGFVRSQVASTLRWQATTIGVTALAIGVPLGVVVGRSAWRAVAGGIGVVDDPVTPAVGLVAVAVTTLVVLNVAALLPSRAARNIAPAAVLRAA